MVVSFSLDGPAQDFVGGFDFVSGLQIANRAPMLCSCAYSSIPPYLSCRSVQIHRIETGGNLETLELERLPKSRGFRLDSL